MRLLLSRVNNIRREYLTPDRAVKYDCVHLNGFHCDVKGRQLITRVARAPEQVSIIYKNGVVEQRYHTKGRLQTRKADLIVARE